MMLQNTEEIILEHLVNFENLAYENDYIKTSIIVGEEQEVKTWGCKDIKKATLKAIEEIQKKHPVKTSFVTTKPSQRIALLNKIAKVNNEHEINSLIKKEQLIEYLIKSDKITLEDNLINIHIGKKKKQYNWETVYNVIPDAIRKLKNECLGIYNPFSNVSKKIKHLQFVFDNTNNG